MIAIGFTPVITTGSSGGGGVSVTTGFLQEDGVSFILLETDDYLLQES